jgi:hypothetical protein
MVVKLARLYVKGRAESMLNHLPADKGGRHTVTFSVYHSALLKAKDLGKSQAINGWSPGSRCFVPLSAAP